MSTKQLTPHVTGAIHKVYALVDRELNIMLTLARNLGAAKPLDERSSRKLQRLVTTLARAHQVEIEEGKRAALDTLSDGELKRLLTEGDEDG